MRITIACDLRHLFGPARDQGPRPTCMAFAASDTHAAVRDGWEPLSCEFAYYQALKLGGGGPDEGATLEGVLQAIKTVGQPPEFVWPYLSQIPSDKSQWKPPVNAAQLYKRESVYNTASLAAIEGRLVAGIPVIVTMLLSDAFLLPDKDGVVANDAPPDPHRRHAVVAVGYGTKGTERMCLIRNSWGVMWGLDGYAWISENYLATRLDSFAELKEDLTDVFTDHNKSIVRSGMG